MATSFLILVLMVTGLTSAAGAETTLDVTTPAGGRHRPGTPTPLLITISSDRAVEGVLVASAGGLNLGQLTVELPGGSAKEVVMVITTPRWGEQVLLRFQADDDEDSQTIQTQLFQAQGDELVGVLPALASRNLPETAALSVDLGVARFFALDPSLMDLGPAAFSTFDSVLVTARDLHDLDPERLSSLRAWIGTNGGTLVVDEAPGTLIPLDYDVGPDPASFEPYDLGLGSVVFTGGLASSGFFDGLIAPTALGFSDELPFGGMFEGMPTTMGLAHDAGLEVPSIGVILIILGVYAFIVGPVLWMLLRRAGRETSLWVAVPLVALLTTAGVYVVGNRQRLGVQAAHSTVVADFPTSRLVSTEVLVSSPNGGWEGVELSAGWTERAANQNNAWMWDERGGSSLPQTQLRGSDLMIDLPPGGTGTVRASSIEPVETPNWDFDLRADGDKIVGTVTNRSGHDMVESFVVVGQGMQRIGAIGAGESHDIRITPGTALALDSDVVGDQMFRFDPWSNAGGDTNPGALLEFLGEHPSVREAGVVMAVGWSRDIEAPLRSSRGSSISAGRTALLSIERIRADVTSESSTRVEIVRGMSTRVLDVTAPGACGEFPMALRLTPAAIPTAGETLVLDASRRTVAAIDVWNGEDWIAGGMANAGAGDRLIEIGPAAFTEGSVFIRMHLSCEFWGQRDFVTLRSAEADDDPVLLTDLAEGVAG